MALSKRGRKRLTILFVAVMVLIGLGFGAFQLREMRRAERLEVAREKGFAQYERGEYDAAMRNLGTVVNLDEGNARALAALADSRRQVPMDQGKHLGISLGLAQSAHATDPTYVLPLEILVDLHVALGQPTELIDAAEKLIELEPGHKEAMWRRAQALTSLGREEAREAAQSFVEAHPDDVRGHGLVLQQMLVDGADTEELRAYADAQAEAHPNSAEFLLLQAETRVRASRSEADLEDVRESALNAAELEVDSPETLARLVQLLDALGLRREADEVLDRRLQEVADAQTVAIAVERDWKAGRTDQAVERLDSALVEGEPDPNLLGWSVLLSRLREDASQSEERYDQLLASDEAAARYWINLLEGVDAMRARRWPAARSSLRFALQSRSATTGGYLPEDVASLLLARTEQRMGEWRSAAERYEQVVARNPQWIGATLELALLYLNHGRLEDALTHGVRALSRQPDSYDAGRALVRILVAKAERGTATPEQLNDATVLVQELRRAVGDDASEETSELRTLEARIAIEKGELDRAARLIGAIADSGVAPPPEMAVSLLEAARRAGVPGADRLLVEGEGPRPPALLEQAARDAAAEGRVEGAKAMFREAIAQAESDRLLDLRRRFARFLADQNDPEGVRMLRELADEHPESPAIQLELLNTPGVWSDEGPVVAAVERLKALGGETGLMWRIYEARRLLTFETSDARAAEAVELLGPAIRGQSPEPAALALAGEAMLTLDDRDVAIDYFSRALDIDPTRVGLYPRLIELLQAQGRTELAEARLREFLEINNPPLPLQRRRAELLEAQGLAGEALGDRRALATREGAGESDRLAYAEALARAGQTERADEVYRELVQTSEPSATALAATARFMASEARTEEGLALLEGAESLEAGRRERLIAGYLERVGRVDEAIERLRALTEEQTEDAGVWIDLARLYVRADRIDEAATAVERARSLRPDDPAIETLATVVSLQQGEMLPDEALSQIADNLGGEETPGPLRDVVEATQRYNESRDLAAFIEDLDRVTIEHPSMLVAWRLLAAARLEAGRTEEAIRAARTAARVMPTEPEAARLATEILAMAGRLDEAAAMAERWRQRSGGDQDEARVALARIEMARGRLVEAFETLLPLRQRIVEEAEARPERLELLATILARAERVEDARSLMEQRAASSEAWLRRYIGVLKAANAPAQTMRAWIADTEAIAGDSSEARRALAQVAFDLATRTGQSADYQRVIDLVENVGDAEERPVAVIVAVAHEQLGDSAQAERWYRSALEVLPDQPVVLNNLAYLLVQRGGEAAEEAVDLATRAVEVGGSSGLPDRQLANFYDTLGAAHLAAGAPGEAIDAYERGLEYVPLHAHLLVGLAEALDRDGRPLEARAALRRVDTASAAYQSSRDLQRRYEELLAKLEQNDAATGDGAGEPTR